MLLLAVIVGRVWIMWLALIDKESRTISTAGAIGLLLLCTGSPDEQAGLCLVSFVRLFVRSIPTCTLGPDSRRISLLREREKRRSTSSRRRRQSESYNLISIRALSSFFCSLPFLPLLAAEDH